MERSPILLELITVLIVAIVWLVARILLGNKLTYRRFENIFIALMVLSILTVVIIYS